MVEILGQLIRVAHETQYVDDECCAREKMHLSGYTTKYR